MLIFLIILLILLFSFLLTPVLIRFSVENKIFKIITDRDIHSKNISNIGGVVIFLSFLFGLLLLSVFNFYNFLILENSHIFLLFASSVIFLIGLYDDIYKLSFLFKFLLQFFLAILFVFVFDVKINSFYGLFGLFDFSDHFLNFFSVFVIVFIINSYNLVDGVDGLATLIGIFINILFSLIFLLNECYFDFYISILLVLSLISFFYYNKPPAKIFMGDSSSLFVGLVISYLSVQACNLPIDEFGTINPVLILCVLAYPSVDTLRVFFIRIFNKKSPFLADKNHIHHNLLKNNFKHIYISYFAFFYSFSLSLICYIFRCYINISFFLCLFFSFLLYFLIFKFMHQLYLSRYQ